MSVTSICTYNVATIGPKQGVREAAVRMREEHVGDLIVVEHRNGVTVPIGILTDRDIVLGVVAKGVPLDSVTVGDAMTSPVLSVKESNGIAFTLREMRRVGVRRAPVVDDDGGLVAVLSVDDAIDHIAAQLADIADAVRFGQDTEAKARP
ncbi:MAG TPA: CBS domain-containing protein, partial [Gammaproteobacteria bacterium]|nr:CBS domain-containing protein [Gammaproteobacteria bacterium]